VSEDHGVKGGAAPDSTSDLGAGETGGGRVEKICVEGFGLAYQDGSVALDGINLSVRKNEILGIMGPARSGKSTLLWSLNRMVDAIPGISRKGTITLDGADILSGGIDPDDLRRRVGMVFDVPVPLPRSIYENIAYGPKLHGVRDRKKLDELVEFGLRSAILWDEVKDRLGSSALRLSGGQQQRLCIARTLALDPEVILLDEPCSGLDPISTLKVEEALSDLKSKYTIVLVTNNTKQAARVSDKTAYFLMGELVEYGRTKQIFTVPRDRRTDDYISGRFG
jgi:phosphate transport system ATP-binding protein